MQVWKALRTAGRRKTWAHENGIGTRDALIAAVVARETAKIVQRLREIRPVNAGRGHVLRTLIAVLGGPEDYPARLWVLKASSDQLAVPISEALGPSKAQWFLGNGILGVLTAPIVLGWIPTYEELLVLALDMTLAVIMKERGDQST